MPPVDLGDRKSGRGKGGRGRYSRELYELNYGFHDKTTLKSAAARYDRLASDWSPASRFGPERTGMAHH
jgi:hypothetical protein